jgi:hypothetical protein
VLFQTLKTLIWLSRCNGFCFLQDQQASRSAVCLLGLTLTHSVPVNRVDKESHEDVPKKRVSDRDTPGGHDSLMQPHLKHEILDAG